MRRITALLLSLWLAVAAAQEDVGDVTDVGDVASDLFLGEILAQTLNPAILLQCVNPELVGICVFLGCDVGGCGVTTSLRLRMSNPDLVTTTSEEPGEDPWFEMRVLYGGLQELGLGVWFSAINTAIDGATPFNDIAPRGGRPIMGPWPRVRSGQVDLWYKEANVYGHPVQPGDIAAFVTQLLPVSFGCPSETEPAFPYYQSALDPLGWRFNIPDGIDPRSWIPGFREMGGGILIGQWSWGSVFPRYGYIMGHYPPKIGQALAHRANSIVTDPIVSPRIYVPTWQGRSSGNMHMEEEDWPGEVDEAGETVRYQMLHPEPDNECHRVAHDNSMQWVEDHTDDDEPIDDKNTAWAAWRRYTCCPAPPAGELLFTIP